MLALTLASLVVLPQEEPVFTIPNPNRLAISPKLNGVIEADEWDGLTTFDGIQSFMQWEPGAVYLAGEVPTGRSARISLDMNGDGWLVGNDNFEITLSPEPRVRRLLQDAQDGARWESAPDLADRLRVQTSETATGWQFELQWSELSPLTFSSGADFRIRIDSPEGDSEVALAPRRMEPVQLVLDRALGLPEGMQWSPDHRIRTVVPGEQIRLRLTFKNEGPEKVGRIDLRTLGFASPFTVISNLPFPKFDRKRRAFVDYEARVAEGSPLGFNRLLARLVTENGAEATIETSYQVTDTVTITPNLRVEKGVADTPRIIRGDIKLVSNTIKSLKGKLNFDLPTTWAMRRGNESPFSIYRARGEAKMIVELVTPPIGVGVIPIPIRVEVNGQEVKQTAYVVID